MNQDYYVIGQIDSQLEIQLKEELIKLGETSVDKGPVSAGVQKCVASISLQAESNYHWFIVFLSLSE